MDTIFDSHAHYESPLFNGDRESLLKALPRKGICAVVNCGSDMDTSERSIALAEKYFYIYAAAGVHPHEAQTAGKLDQQRLAALLEHPRVKALGEIGLDYHYDYSPPGVQKNFFAGQLDLAVSMDLPVIVHDREAHADTLELLKKYRPRGVVHCFSGSAELAREVCALGMYIGLGGAVTFKNARRPLEVAREIPIDRLLLETDAPYMAPAPYRGQRCDSSHIPYSAEKIAQVRGVSRDEILSAGCQNACALFEITLDT